MLDVKKEYQMWSYVRLIYVSLWNTSTSSGLNMVMCNHVELNGISVVVSLGAHAVVGVPCHHEKLL